MLRLAVVLVNRRVLDVTVNSIICYFVLNNIEERLFTMQKEIVFV